MTSLSDRSEAISAAEANRAFSRLLRQVRDEGRQFTVTSHGTPIARIVPMTAGEHDAALDEAEKHRAFLEWLKAQPIRVVGPWSRQELYDAVPTLTP